MNSRVIYAMVGIAVLATSTLGFGASLSTTSAPDRIGSDDDVTVPATDADVTEITWTESNNEITSATVKVKNTDTGAAHTFEICVISKAGASISDTVGTSADCGSTGSISASATGSVTITFSIALNAANVDATNLSIEQTV